ncbi:MAG: hypothetical protein AB1544_13880 [Pseudomonadota bacterium]|jgi:hypothetical protein
MHISGKTVDAAAKIVKAAIPEVIEKLKESTMTIHEATGISRLNKTAQKKVVAIDNKRLRSEELNAAAMRSASCKRRWRDGYSSSSSGICAPFFGNARSIMVMN